MALYYISCHGKNSVYHDLMCINNSAFDFCHIYFWTDSHHKLIRWRIVTHGGIDGYSRLIVYLKSAGNVTASTVYDSFLEAVQKYHLPSRVRSDQGGENILVAQHMIQNRGANRNSIIVGASVHNQRIERLWKDMHKCVTSLYYRLFYFMEQHDLLNPLNEKHLFALHYIFLPRINRSLIQFVDSWNHHPIRTAHHKSPHQLFTSGLLYLRNSGLTALDLFEDADSTYGIDYDTPVASQNDRDDVEVPGCAYHISEANLAALKLAIDPLQESNEYGIDIYESTIQFLDNLPSAET